MVCQPKPVLNAVKIQTHINKPMTLGNLKTALAKFPPDMNDMQMIVVYATEGKTKIELVGFVGYIPTKGLECIAVGGLSEIKRRVEAGEMPPPDGYDEISDGI